MFEDPRTDPRLEMTLKTTDWSSWADEDCSPSPPSDSTKALDLTQPMEDDNCASLARSLDETVDWSQSAGGDVRDLPVLDPHVHEFPSGTEVSGSRGNKPN